MRMSWLALVAVLMALPVSIASAADGDAEKGERVFNKCKACHAIDEPKNKVGPHLVGVVGRPAGAVEGYKYSSAMKDSGLVWDEATLDGYLAQPRKFLKGNKMSFVGLRKTADRADVIAYLKAMAGQ